MKINGIRYDDTKVTVNIKNDNEFLDDFEITNRDGNVVVNAKESIVSGGGGGGSSDLTTAEVTITNKAGIDVGVMMPFADDGSARSDFYFSVVTGRTDKLKCVLYKGHAIAGCYENGYILDIVEGDAEHSQSGSAIIITGNCVLEIESGIA